jgi:hypothetical protein
LAQKKSVSPQYLLEGAVYALEQCGLLLRDANLLYRNGSYSSAVAVALFATEELGRWSILLDPEYGKPLKEPLLHVAYSCKLDMVHRDPTAWLGM